MRRNYSRYGQWQPNFKVCKSEGGNFNCPSEYVREFGAWPTPTDNPLLFGVVAGVLGSVALELVTKKSVAKLLRIKA